MAEMKAVVVGAGMMGPGIAITLALGGIETRLSDLTTELAEAGLAQAHQLLEQLQTNELIDPGAAASAKPLLSSTTDLDGSIRSAEIVIEAIKEDLAIKQELFARMDQIANRETLLATNTSGLSVTAIAAKSHRFPERILSAHFWFPPHLLPLVEVVMTDRTGEEQAQRALKILRQCGKAPVLVRKDRPGMLGNRLQHALIREAVYIVQEGIASAEDVDLAAMTGFGLRMPAYGIFEHADNVGLRLVKAIQDSVDQDLCRETHAGALLNEKVERGEVGASAGRGFLDWKARSMDDVKARRDAFLIDFLRKQKKAAKRA
jgi:3-hydroxybutyryl-CoA dehydrogenase